MCALYIKIEILLYQKYHRETTDQPEAKDWNFPKMHTHIHGFDDVQNKGTTRNYNTKPNEKLHGPIKEAYRNQTNFKNVAPQVS